VPGTVPYVATISQSLKIPNGRALSWGNFSAQPACEFKSLIEGGNLVFTMNYSHSFSYYMLFIGLIALDLLLSGLVSFFLPAIMPKSWQWIASKARS
jgi:hypothetical protein